MKVVLLGLLGNIAIFMLFAFAHWEISPVYWIAEWRAFCAVLMGAITLVVFAYFIIDSQTRNKT